MKLVSDHPPRRSTSRRTASPALSGRRSLLALLVLALGLLVVAVSPHAVAGQADEAEPGMEVAPGDEVGAPGAEGERIDLEGTVTEDDGEVWMVVGALVAVAVALTVVTIIFWLHTRPRSRPLSFLDEFDEDADVLVPVED